MSKFKVILTAIFVLCIAGGVAAFATFKSNSSGTTLPTITIWGTFPQAVFNQWIQKLNQTRATALNINYSEIPQAGFKQALIEELARGRGPDALLIPQQEILGIYDKLVEIPNTVLTQRDFQNTYIRQADLYLTANGTIALPVVIDPLVMYWNKTLFTNAGIAKPPVYWDEFSDITKKITLKDDRSNIRRSAIALGEFKNINHPREIFSALLLQSGNPITFYSDGNIQSGLGDSSYSGAKTSSPAVLFYTQFSDPRDSQYSWNRSLPSSKNSFLSGTLSTYFGFTSELSDIREKNANIDFDVSPLPQIRTGKTRLTFGNMYGLSMARSATDQASTYAILQILTAPDALSILNTLTYLPSVRRDVIAGGSKDPYMSIFLDGALISKSWLDSSPSRSLAIFTELIESVTSGKSDVYTALKQADDELNISLQNR